MCGCLSHAPSRDLACGADMCPDWESNRQPFGSQPVLNALSYISQGPSDLSITIDWFTSSKVLHSWTHTLYTFPLGTIILRCIQIVVCTNTVYHLYC